MEYSITIVYSWLLIPSWALAIDPFLAPYFVAVIVVKFVPAGQGGGAQLWARGARGGKGDKCGREHTQRLDEAPTY